jgi:hypothetical protein
VRSNSKNSDDSNSKRNGNNFFQDIFQSAFANDRDLLSQRNKRVGMLDEGIVSGDDDSVFVLPKQAKEPELTPTQLAWRQKMLSSSTQQQVQTTDLIDSTIRIDLYLSGIPNKDPSNDLYASKTNISLRDRSVGQVLPTVPTIANIYVSFLPDFKCAVSMKPTKVASIEIDNDNENDTSPISMTPSEENGNNFVNTDIIGDWKLSEDGKLIRFRISVYGFQRTIQTKGTIQKIYWSNEKESITETSTLYSIPEGWLYFETELLKRSNGSIQWMASSIGSSTTKMNPTSSASSSVSNGIIKVEQTTGFLGIASRMVPCGKFIVTES